MKTVHYLIAGGVLVATVLAVLWTRPTQQAQATKPKAAVGTTVSLADVAKHAGTSDCWTTIEGKVYNLTDYIQYHPGGSRIIQACGKDATDLFNGMSPMGRMHSQMARQILAKYIVGNLAN